MGSDQRKRPQMTTVIDPEKRALAVAIAKKKKEHDAIGTGLSVVVRREVERYINRYRSELTEADVRAVYDKLERDGFTR